jgi:hypothetical protein
MPGIIDSEEALGLWQRRIWDDSHPMSEVEGEWVEVAAEVHGGSRPLPTVSWTQCSAVKTGTLFVQPLLSTSAQSSVPVIPLRMIDANCKILLLQTCTSFSWSCGGVVSSQSCKCFSFQVGKMFWYDIFIIVHHTIVSTCTSVSYQVHVLVYNTNKYL